MTTKSPDRTLKIALASWAPFIGGAEVAVERLALGLQQEGHVVFLIVGTRGEALERFEAAGIRCLVVEQRFTDKKNWLKYRRSRNLVLEILRDEQPDIVHSNDLPTHQMISDAAAKMQFPRVCHHRWVFEGEAIDWFNKHDAEHHLFVSNALMQDLIGESEKLKASSRKVVYDGLRLPYVPVEDDRADARAEIGLSQNKTIVLFAGQIIERKGVADLLLGWDSLKDKWQDQAELHIVGDDLAGEGAYRREMEQLAAELDCPVSFHGFQKNVDQWLIASDIVMVPSHVEPLGNATLEAMAQGRPVIGGNAGGIPEMVVHNKTGLLVPPKTPKSLAVALEHLLEDPKRRSQFGEAARRRCEEKFSLQAHTQAVLAEYERVLSMYPVSTHS